MRGPEGTRRTGRMAGMFRVDRLESGVVTVLRLEGHMIDMSGVDVLRGAFEGCIEDLRLRVVVNMNQTGFLLFPGVVTLAEMEERLRRLGGGLKLAGANLHVRQLLRMCGVNHELEVCKTEARAIELLAAASVA